MLEVLIFAVAVVWFGSILRAMVVAVNEWPKRSYRTKRNRRPGLFNPRVPLVGVPPGAKLVLFDPSGRFARWFLARPKR